VSIALIDAAENGTQRSFMMPRFGCDVPQRPLVPFRALAAQLTNHRDDLWP
jgi:hypothetical protein